MGSGKQLITSLLIIASMTQQYHALQPPHGPDTLTLPDANELLRAFFVQCTERREFQSAQSEREQVHYCARWRESAPIRVSLQNLADFFQVSKSTIQYHISRPFDLFDGCDAGTPGRPSLFTPEQMQELLNYIEERFNCRMPVSYEDIREFSEERWGIIPHSGTLRSIIGSWEAVKLVDGVPMEDSRLYASCEEIERYFDDLEEVITTGDIPAAFIVNVDESGFDQFVDARQSRRIVPARYDLNSVPVGVSRTEKRATLIAAICGDGAALKPLVVVHRETVETELLLRGYTSDKVILKRSDTGFVNTGLFIEWAQRSLFPAMRQRRAEMDYDGPILLIMDGFSCHQSDRFLELCEPENIVCRLIPPHTSDQLQPLDLGIFGIQKRWQTNITVESSLNCQTKQIIKICDSYRMATTHKNVVAAFKRAGLVTRLDETTLTLMMDVNRSCATAVREVADQTDHDRNGKRRLRI